MRQFISAPDIALQPSRVEIPTDAPDLDPTHTGHGDVCHVDRIRLAVNPSTVMSERFQLQDLELVMGGSSEEHVTGTRVLPP